MNGSKVDGIMRPKTLGIIFVISSSLLWAFQPVLVKNSSGSSVQMVAVASVIAGLVALAYSLMTKSGFSMRGKAIPSLIYVTFAGSLLADVLYFYSLQRVPALNAVLLAHMQPIFIVLIGVVFLKEDRLSKWDYLGISVMVVAALFVTTKTLENALLMRMGTFGDLMVLVSTVLWASTTIVAKKYLQGVGSGALVMYRYLSAGVVILVFAFVHSGFFVPDLFQIVLGVSIGVGMIFYYEALRRLKAAQTSALELITPFFAAAFGFLFLMETVTWMQVLGIALLFLGVFFIAKREK